MFIYRAEVLIFLKKPAPSCISRQRPRLEYDQPVVMAQLQATQVIL